MRIGFHGRRHRCRWLVPLAFLALLAILADAQAQALPRQALAALVGHVHERNALADPVAVSKWCSGASVQDVAREREVLEQAAAAASSRGVAPGRARRLFAALIEANKQVQYLRLWEWRSGEAPPPSATACANAGLAAVRESLNQLQPLLLQDLLQTEALARRPDCEERLARAISSEIHRHRLHSSAARALVRGLGGFCEPAPPQR